jgi:hypothetical protein
VKLRREDYGRALITLPDVMLGMTWMMPMMAGS